MIASPTRLLVLVALASAAAALAPGLVADGVVRLIPHGRSGMWQGR
jgi:hypothetical protein